MKVFTLFFATFYGTFSIILGAFGSHLFKKILSEQRLQSFEIGVKYQMYSAIYLLIIGFFLNFDTILEKTSSITMILGVFLFSVSIYLLSFSEVWNVNLKFLGPVTPIGGLLMILSWLTLMISIFRLKF